MKHALAIVALVVAAGCARRVPPRATALDAERASVALADLERGRELLIAKCGSRCHKTPMPGDHTAAEWPHELDEMSERAKLTPVERAAIERYVITMASAPTTAQR